METQTQKYVVSVTGTFTIDAESLDEAKQIAESKVSDIFQQTIDRNVEVKPVSRYYACALSTLLTVMRITHKGGLPMVGVIRFSTEQDPTRTVTYRFTNKDPAFGSPDTVRSVLMTEEGGTGKKSLQEMLDNAWRVDGSWMDRYGA